MRVLKFQQRFWWVDEDTSLLGYDAMPDGK